MIGKIRAIFTIIAAAVCIFGISASAIMIEYDDAVHEYTGSVYDLYVRNKKIEPALEPIIFNDRALVPIRDVFEEVGAIVEYYGDTQTIEVYGDNGYVRIKINDNTAYVNGERTTIPDNLVPKLISKVGGETKTMVPVRFISDSIGLDIEFDAEKGAIMVESNGYPTSATPTPTPTKTPTPTVTPSPTKTPTPSATPDAVNIKSITYTNVSNGAITVLVEMDKKCEYSHFTLSSPERVVVDIKNAKLSSGDKTINVNNGGITAIRVGVDSERTRVVVDTNKTDSYTVSYNGNNIVIYVLASATTSSTTQPTASATIKPSQSPTLTPSGNATSTPTTNPSAPTPTPTISPSRPASNAPYNKEVIVLDAGHGGYDPGAQGTLDGKTINESDLTLSIANKVKNILEQNGYTVLMTRTDDTYKTLTERPAVANENLAALFISIHINSVNNIPDAHGTEVYYAISSDSLFHNVKSSVLARNVISSMIDSMGSFNRGVKTAEHAVTKRANMPSCLVEVGFISNEDELRKMCDSAYQTKVAQGIANGIIKTSQKMN